MMKNDDSSRHRLGAILAAVLALIGAATFSQAGPTMRDENTGRSFCECSYHQGVWINTSQTTCAQACGGGNSSFPQQNMEQERLRLEQQRQEAERQEAQRQAAEERARLKKEAEDKAIFLRQRDEAASSLKGLGAESHHETFSSEPALKGLSDTEGPALKGLGPERSEEPAPSRPKECRITDECSSALETQTKALEAARHEQNDLYRAVVQTSVGHGVDLAQGVGEEKLKKYAGLNTDAPTIFVWKSEADSGFRKDYKDAIEKIADVAQRAAVAKLVAKHSAAKLKEAQELAGKLNDFAEYMRELQLCLKVPDAQFNRCVNDKNKLHEKLLDWLPVEAATAERVRAAGDALTRYSTRSLDRAMAAGKAASQCFKGCR